MSVWSELTSWGTDSTEAGPMARARHKAAEKVKGLGDIFDIVEYKARRKEFRKMITKCSLKEWKRILKRMSRERMTVRDSDVEWMKKISSETESHGLYVVLERQYL